MGACARRPARIGLGDETSGGEGVRSDCSCGRWASGTGAGIEDDDEEEDAAENGRAEGTGCWMGIGPAMVGRVRRWSAAASAVNTGTRCSGPAAPASDIVAKLVLTGELLQLLSALTRTFRRALTDTL